MANQSRSKMEQQLSDDDGDDASYVMVDFEDYPKIFGDSDKLSYASDNSSSVVEEAETTGSSSSSDESSCSEVDAEGEMFFPNPIENPIKICLKLQEPGTSWHRNPHDVSMKNRNLRNIVKFDVLPLLPAKLLLKFRSVSRDWDRWISSPFLAHQQSYLHRHLSGFFRQSLQSSHAAIDFIGFGGGGGVPSPSLEFLPESVSLINASHGLLLCRGDGWLNNNAYYVCNPLTKKYRELPKSTYYHEPDSAILVFEPSVLNFDSDYKVVAAHSMVDQPLIFFEVYCSKENAWRCMDTTCFELDEVNVKFVECFYMKGCVYWQTLSGSIVMFDLKTDYCGVVFLPVGLNRGVLAELQGELSYIQISEINLMNIYQGWNFGVMKTVQLPISRDPTMAKTGVTDQSNCRVLQSVKGEILMILCENRIYCYHLKEGEVVMVNRNKYNKWEAKYLPYVNSLATLEP